MSTNVEMPEAFTAGTTVSYTRTLADYPASAGWVMTLYLAGVGVIGPVTAVQSGDSFVITIPAASSANAAAGSYRWVERVSKAGEVYDAAEGVVVVNSNIAAAVAGSEQTFEEQCLTLIEAAILKRIPEDMEQFQIEGRAISRYPQDKLHKLRAKYQALVAQQRNPGGDFGRQVLVRFARPQ